jgi:glycosyltransferase involved in cell wall biosynthesis
VKKRLVCHITTVHHPLDTRIFFRECISLSEEYEVRLYAPYQLTGKHNVRHIKLPAFKFLFSRLLISYPILLWKLLIHKKAVIYHLHDPELLPLALLLRFFSAKVILDVHEWTVQDIPNKKLPFRKLFVTLYVWFEHLASKKIHFILAENSYEQYYKNRVSAYSVIQNYPDHNAFVQYRHSNRHSKKLFYIGNLTGNRGMKQMISIITSLKSRNENFELICIGRHDNSLKKYLTGVSDYQNVKSQIHFIDYLPLTEALKFSTDCLAGIALYDDLPNHRDSLSTKMFEYMAVGLPVITSDFPLYRDIIEKNDCGYCIHPDSTELLTDAVLGLYNNQQLAKSMALNGINAISNYYNWESEKQKLFSVYQNLLS